LSGRGLCDELITRPEESYRLWCVVVCDLETSRISAPYIYDISSLRVNIYAGRCRRSHTRCQQKCINKSEQNSSNFMSESLSSLKQNNNVWRKLKKGCLYLGIRHVQMEQKQTTVHLILILVI